jgi:hypothetical protein
MKVAPLTTLFVLAAVLFAGHPFLPTVAAQQPDEVGPFMRAKLDHAQKVMEGLALEDYAVIAKHSQELSLISQASNWQVLQTPEYRNQSTEFRRATDAIRNAAQKKNLDGATLAFMEMTLKCVQCHKYVRDVRAADFTEPPALLRAAGK